MRQIDFTVKISLTEAGLSEDAPPEGSTSMVRVSYDGHGTKKIEMDGKPYPADMKFISDLVQLVRGHEKG